MILTPEAEQRRRNISKMVSRLRKEDIKELSDSELDRCLNSDEKLILFAKECITIGLLDMVRLYPDRFNIKPVKKKQKPEKKKSKRKGRK